MPAAVTLSPGASLVAGGLLWQPALALEKLADPSTGSALWYADQAAFLVAQLLLLRGFAGVVPLDVLGTSRIARGARRLLTGAWFLVTVGGALQLARVGAVSDAVTGVGGLLTYPATLTAGIAAARARWTEGWGRWSLLGQGTYMAVILLLPAMLLGADPSWPAEAGWQLGWVAVGAAVHHSRVRAGAAPLERSAPMAASRTVRRGP